MAVYRALISFQADSAFPRDAITISPHFSGDDPQGIANTLKTNLAAVASIGTTKRFVIKVYDAQKAPPSYPLATAEQGTGSFATATPRELALCLSYYAQWNRPRFRGRLYLPGFIVGGAALNLRPTAGQITTALAFRSVLTTGFPSGNYWVVYSPTSNTAAQVTHCWVDDEWDVVRSRGLRGETRQVQPV